MATVQPREPTEGRAYYDRKKASGKTSMEAMRCLKRRLSDIVYRHMVDDAMRAMTGPGGHPGTSTKSSVTGSHPTPALRTSHFPDLSRPSLRPLSQRRLDTEGRHERATRRSAALRHSLEDHRTLGMSGKQTGCARQMPNGYRGREMIRKPILYRRSGGRSVGGGVARLWRPRPAERRHGRPGAMIGTCGWASAR
jgi:hypothetical protein